MDTHVAAQQYLTRSLTRFDDELFPLLYKDFDSKALSIADQVFSQRRSVSIYGVRGIGKTTLMQGVFWQGLQKYQQEKFLPVNVSLTGANSASNQKELEEKFYRAVLEGLIVSGGIGRRYQRIKGILSSHVPWIAAAAVTAAGLVFPPAAAAAGGAQKGTKALLNKFGIKSVESLLISRDIDPKVAVNFILKELADRNIIPVFAIDELDKVPHDTMLTDFFNGQQGWFQDKICIIAISYTYGNSLNNLALTSAKRFSDLEFLEGVKTDVHLNEILNPRLLLGISDIEIKETKAKKTINNLFADEVPKQIVNSYTPIIHLMLEAANKAIKNANKMKAAKVDLLHLDGARGKITPPSETEGLILDLLVKKNMTPTELQKATGKGKSVIARVLSKMYSKHWISKLGKGKGVKYVIKQKGDAARHLK